MKQTEHYQLSQWEKTDRILMADFNGDNAKIDAALAAEKAARESAVAALNQTVAGLGNCKIVCGSYSGSGLFGADHPNVLTFDGCPLAVLIANRIFLVRGASGYTADPQYPKSASYVTWTDDGVSWYNGTSASWQCSADGATYYYVALFAAD